MKADVQQVVYAVYAVYAVHVVNRTVIEPASQSMGLKSNSDKAG
jgi:hypothetical protein